MNNYFFSFSSYSLTASHSDTFFLSRIGYGIRRIKLCSLDRVETCACLTQLNIILRASRTLCFFFLHVNYNLILHARQENTQKLVLNQELIVNGLCFIFTSQLLQSQRMGIRQTLAGLVPWEELSGQTLIRCVTNCHMLRNYSIE